MAVENKATPSIMGRGPEGFDAPGYVENYTPDCVAEAKAHLDGRSDVLHVWTWRDQAREVLGYTARFDWAKSLPFFTFERDDEGVKRWKRPAEKPWPLFGLDSLGRDGDVFVTEGEKDCCAVQSLGLMAVSPGGSTYPNSTDWKPLDGVGRVYILRDNDPAGEQFAQKVVDNLARLDSSPSAFVATLPDLPESGDVCDWIAAQLPDSVAWNQLQPVPESHAAATREGLLKLLPLVSTPGKPSPKPKTPPRPVAPSLQDGPYSETYLDRIWHEELAALASMTPGAGVNNKAHNVAVRLGELIHCGRWGYEAAYNAIFDAVVRTGCEQKRYPAHRRTIQNSLQKGMSDPDYSVPRTELKPDRKRPGKPDNGRKPGAPGNGRNGSAGMPTETTQPPGRQEALSELGAARRLTALHASDIKHSSVHGWFHWDGRRWKPEAFKPVRRLAQKLGHAYREEAVALRRENPDFDELKWIKFARNLERNATMDAVLKITADQSGVDADAITWDASAHLLNCANGTLNLETGTLQEHDREDYISRLCETPYNATDECSRWLKFLDEIFEGDSELISYLQWVAGYALTGNTDAQCFWILYGGGLNGKSVFLNALRHAVGLEYSAEIAPESLMQSGRPGDKNYALAALRAARLVLSAESDQGNLLNASLLKAATGGEPIQAEVKYQQPFTFLPAFKLLFATNHKPRIKDTSLGMWRRIRLIPFEVQIPRERIDRHLLEKLKAEREGILAWAARGILHMGRIGNEPPVPERVKAATSEYRAAEDVIAQFLAECCMQDSSYVARSKDLAEAYTAFSGSKITTNAMTRTLQERGFKRHKTARGHGVKGLALKAEFINGSNTE